MTLSIGSRLGPYEILAPIGAGGMGEVFRARDTNLGRDVAIKVLPDGFARDAARMARFGREAKLLAALNYSGIATIHGLETAGDTRALVMELAEGPTLLERIRQGPLPIDEALEIAKQIAEALEYAHEHGIIHRDLKPANVKVASNDTVKILDFGLAKAMESDLSPEELANSPTLSRMATAAGVLLGTAAYMSPEQAKGKPVDRRADIWAFGCVLYEMLTGTKVFRGDTVTDTMAAVIRGEPDWSQLPAATPMQIRVLLQRCLQKNVRQRLQAMGDARISLEEVLSGAPDSAPLPAPVARPGKPWRLWLSWGVTGVFVLATALLAYIHFNRKPPTGQAMRFEIPIPEKLNLGGALGVSMTLSPDGRKLAFVGTGADGQTRLWVRSVETLEARPLEGTEGATGYSFWSPDSRFIAFAAQGKLKKIEAAGGPSETLCDASVVLGGTWTRDDKIVFGSSTGVMQVAASGGSASPITIPGFCLSPSSLPDGRHFVYWRASREGESDTGIYVGSVDTKPQQQVSKRLLPDNSTVAYAPSLGDPAVGYLLFVRGNANAPYGALGTLMAQRFDTRRLELVGEAIPIAEQVPDTSFSASVTDVLVYLRGFQPVLTQGSRGNIRGQLTWFDREGKVLGSFGDPGVYRSLALSPDGKRVAFERVDPQNAGTRNIWLYEFGRGVTTRFTFDSAWDAVPVWSPDGSRVAFSSTRGGEFDLYEKASNLAGEDGLLFKSSENKSPSSWSPDGRFLLYYIPTPPPNHIFVLPLGSGEGDRKPAPFARSTFNEAWGRFSPDGRWIAYVSDESGRFEVYVQPFDPSSVAGSSSLGRTPVTGKWMVSKDGGNTPLWRHDGKELFYLSLDGQAMAVEVSTSGVFQAGVPKALFKVPPGVLFWDVSADGKRFLMAAPSSASVVPQPPFTVVLNWQAALKK